MVLDTVAKHRQAFYRLVGTTGDDDALTEQGEGATDVVDLFLTRGAKNAQRWMLKTGYKGWLKRSAALSWSGSDAADGGRYTALPADFLRAYGDQRVSALRKPDGDPWGSEVDGLEGPLLKGDGFYFQGEQLWLTRGAAPPSVLHLKYHYTHPKWDDLDDGDIDFPLDARPLIVAEAANVAKEENWLLGGVELEAKIERALFRAREEARDIARPTKQARTFRRPRRIANRW